MLPIISTGLEVQVRKRVFGQTPKQVGAFLRNRLPGLGPTFTKFGQWTASRPDVFGVELCKELEGLQDRVLPMPFKEVQGVIDATKGELNRQIAHVNAKPLASASIAQVHLARLTNGTTVVIKVARPGIMQQIKNDMNQLDSILRTFEIISPEGVSETRTMIQQFEKQLVVETDFKREAAQLARFQQMYSNNPFMRVPRVMTKLCSSNILVMEYLPSIKLETIPAEQRNDMAKLLMCSFMMQVLQGKMVHGDPHAGNMGMHTTTRQLVLYDFGNVLELPPRLQVALKKVVLLIMDRDIDAIIALFPDLGINVLNADNLRNYVETYITYIESLDPDDLLSSTAFTSPPSSTSQTKVPLTISVQLICLLRIFSMLEGICKKLNPQFSYTTIFPIILLQMAGDSDLMWDKTQRDVMTLFRGGRR